MASPSSRSTRTPAPTSRPRSGPPPEPPSPRSGRPPACARSRSSRSTSPVRVADIDARVHDEPRYHRAGAGGAEGRLGSGRGSRRPCAGGGALPDGLPWSSGTGTARSRPRPPLDGYLAELTMVHPDQPADALEEAAARYVTPPSRAGWPPPTSPAGPTTSRSATATAAPSTWARTSTRSSQRRGPGRWRISPSRRGPAPPALLDDVGAGLHGVQGGVVALRPRGPVLGPRAGLCRAVSRRGLAPLTRV